MDTEPSQDDVHREVERGQRDKPWQRYLDAALGLRNYWYPVLFSHELQEGETRPETVLGERLFFKRINGTVYCVEDRCLHRGVPFSARPECYTAQDIHEDTQPRFWDEHLVTHPVVRTTIKCNWRVAAENGIDAAHIYGHRHWIGMQQSGRIRPFGTYPSRQDIVQILEEDGKPKGIVKQDDMHVYARQIEGQEIRVPLWPQDAPDVVQTEPRAGWVGCYMPCGLQVEGFPKLGKVHFEWYVPLDEDHHHYMILQAGYARTDEEKEAFFKEAETLARLTWQEPGTTPEGFTNFDAFARRWSHHAYAKEDWWHRERLFKPDYIIMQWRMVVARHARGIQAYGNWAPVEADD